MQQMTDAEVKFRADLVDLCHGCRETIPQGPMVAILSQIIGAIVGSCPIAMITSIEQTIQQNMMLGMSTVIMPTNKEGMN
jgi:hypothetical protein